MYSFVITVCMLTFCVDDLEITGLFCYLRNRKNAYIKCGAIFILNLPYFIHECVGVFPVCLFIR